MPRISSSWIIHLQYMLGSSDSKDDPWSYLDGLTPLGVHQVNLFTVVPPCLSLPTNKFLLIIWPTPWAGKMNQILSCDWLPKRVRQDYLAHFGLPIVSRKKNSHESHNIRSFTDQACLVKMAGYWPRSFFCQFMGFNSVSVHKQKKKTWPISSHLDLMLGQ